MPQTYKSRQVLERFALPAAQKIERNRAAGIVEEKPSAVFRLANAKNTWFAFCVLSFLFAAGQVLWWFTQ